MTNLKILSVEDEAVSQRIMVSLLEPYGKVTTCSTSEEAWAKFTEARTSGAPYDLILLDINLPGLNGVELLDEIRQMELEGENGPSTPAKIIMVTGESDPEAFIAASAAGCTSYLAKPVDRRKLLSELVRLELVAQP